MSSCCCCHQNTYFLVCIMEYALWSMYCQFNSKPTTGQSPYSGLSPAFITALLAFLSRSSGSKEKLIVCNIGSFLTAPLGQLFY